MVASTQVRTVDFLPEIFQTPVNKQFLNATLDQLTQEPRYKTTQGYIGQKVGPGVNPADSYVIEPTQSRSDYQLEPGVVSLDPTTLEIKDAITYPGILDALKLQGAPTTKADRLFESEYYSWDPFVDWDKYINYSQYYWLPESPTPVTVSATSVPLEQTFNVTRANGYYTFSGVSGNNPSLTLARNGNYNFNIAQNDTASVQYRVSNKSNSYWIIDYQNNPSLTLTRGNTYTFDLTGQDGWKFYIKSSETFGTTNVYNNGVTNNGASTGLITFTVPQDAPDTLYYVNPTEFNLRGTFTIVDAIPGSGPNFWIQSQPGINGRLPWSPNISSRDVLGVSNNGIDLGTVQFNVPDKSAQDFYLNMTNIGSVDMIVPSTLLFDQINGVSVDAFFEAYPTGIDGITNLNGRTLVFTSQSTSVEIGGWYQESPFDPLATNATNPNPAISGGYDTQTFSQTYEVSDPAVQFGIWQIQYVTNVNGVEFIQLNPVTTVDNLSQFTITYGTQYANTQWYKNAQGFFQQQPLITANLPFVYYQDELDPTIFGVINFIDEEGGDVIDVNTQILGQTNYTSPNGVVFTNGLVVKFSGAVYPTSYLNETTYYVEGVGTGIKLLDTANFVTPEPFVIGVGVPYDSTPYDSTGYDAELNQPLDPQYMTINRASQDLNSWTRGNRWFHVDVIEYAAAFNNVQPNYKNAQRARRPILEFRAGTKLFNFGTDGIPPISLIDFTQTDALSNVNGQSSYVIDGYYVAQGQTVVFAADSDPDVRNQVYTVNFIVPEPEVSLTPIIDLVATSYSPALPNQTTVCILGLTTQGVSYTYTGTTWVEAQQQTANNQPPLFDVYDANGYSFGDTTVYPSTNFIGCKLLSYAENPDNTIDPVLGIPLDFFSLNNIGDIIFTNNLYTDTFIYTPVSAGVTVDVSTGFVREYQDRLLFTSEIGWQTAAILSLPRQQFQFSYDGTPLQFDILASTNNIVPAVQIFINNVFQNPNTYTVGVNSTTNTTVINLTGTGYVIGDIIEVLMLSDQVSSQGFYEVPINLENNPFNVNSPSITLGGARNHYATICENLLNIQGPINGPNNTRDLGNIVPYGTQVVQQSSPLTLAGYFLRSQKYDIFSSIEYNSREYIKFKSKLLTQVTNMDITPTMTVPQILDLAISQINTGLTSNNAFYWSDMVPAGSNYTSSVTVVNPITIQTFNTIQTYNFTTSNYLGLLVYLNGELLLRGTDYTVSADAPKLTILIPLSVGDVVTINEYSSTVGNFVPNTPTKMGLYPKYLPEIFIDETYSEPTPVIRGHDGSITIAWSDIRDQVLLEFEKRIYDNMKVDNNPIPLSTEQVNPDFFPAMATALLPGFFRKTPYTYDEINEIMSESFYTWVGQNKVNYVTQDFNVNNPFTYNYSQAGNRLDETTLLGNWRGIYRYFYDTETPNLTPWEMVGFSEMPAWWEMQYGPAPYTSGNNVLWDDMEAGIVADPAGPYILTEYARPGLSEVIPAGSEGELLPPTQSVIGLYNPTDFTRNWVAGDGGPVEASWWKSSNYPFAIMRMLALTKPAEFFSLFADRDLYRYDTSLGQYLYNGRYRLDANGVQVYGNGVSKASYINWIVDYNRQLGLNSTTELTNDLANLDVRLCYRMAAFSDKQYVNIYTERAGPGSTNNSLLIPPESYNVLFYKNEPFQQITYSAVVVEVTANGYSVFGYSNVNPYFTVQVSSTSGVYQTVEAGGVAVSVPKQYTDNTVQIPYGYTFTNTAEVVDFLLSYGENLTRNGLIFDTVENAYTMDWTQMAKEFLYFAGQGWAESTMINLNPAATTLKASRPISVVDTIASLTPENMLLDQQQQVLDARTLIINRDQNAFSVTTTTNSTISFLTLRYTNYEDMVVLDNTSNYNDLIYDPATGSRQVRLNIIAFTSTEWDGQLNAKGFILNLNNIVEWKPYQKYTKGDIVLYKNTYWSAQDIVQPTEEFNYNVWRKSDYQLIDEGLLPNLANKANQLANTYDIYSADLASDNDLFAFGLIGFRPRQYMSDLNLNFNTQVQLYQQFLGTKGTKLAAEVFTFANLGKESGDYQIYENWAIQAGTYGAQANRSFFELQLNQSLLKYNPSTLQVINPGEVSQANQTVLLQDLWKESYKIQSTNIMPTTYEGSGTSTGLPSAGYVCLDDVDVNVFNLEDPSAIEADINNIGIGTYIWIAKINSYNWGVYRTGKVPGQLTKLSDNLDRTSLATFNDKHGLTVGDLIIVKYFNNAIDGVYRVLSAPSLTTILISYAFVNTDVTTINGTGLVFKLDSARVSQASDIATLGYVNRLIPGEKVWIDDNGEGLWEVVEKQSPFANSLTFVPGLTTTSRYGVSVTQATNNSAMLVGVPGENKLYPYVQTPTIAYVQSDPIELTVTDTADYGSFVTFGNKQWALAGAPGSNSGAGYAVVVNFDVTRSLFTQHQLLLNPTGDYSAIGFGTAGTISIDEQWMYVSAPGANKVYAYNLVQVEPQTVRYTTDGTTSTFNYSDVIQINSSYPEQLIITLNGIELTVGYDCILTSTDVEFTIPPLADQKLVITRRVEKQLNYYVYEAVQQTTTSGFGEAAVFTVTNENGKYKVVLAHGGVYYAPGDTITISYTEVSPTGDYLNNLTLTVVSVTSDGAITGFTTAGTGAVVTTFTLENYFYTISDSYSFSVRVNGQPQRPNLDYTYNESTTTLTFTTTPSVGAEILVYATDSWQYVNTITIPGLDAQAQFGASVATTTDGRQIFIGAPNTTVNGLGQAGATYVFDRSVIDYTVTNASQLTYAIPTANTAPITVQLNNQYLVSTDASVNGQYTITGSNVVFSNITLTVGDIITINTNQFTLVQQLNPSTPSYEAQFGYAVDSCPLNCSVYVGAPFDSTYVPQAGSVDHLVNQSRVYGVTTSTIANPTFPYNGATLRINNELVNVPGYPNNNVQGLVSAINTSGIPNVIATATPDLTFKGDGLTQVFDIGATYSTATSYTTLVYINNNRQTDGVDYTYNPSTEQISFLVAPAPNATIIVVSGRLTISVLNGLAATTNEMLTVLPGFTTDVFDGAGFETFVWTQNIVSPAPSVYAQFGSSLSIDNSAINLIVGAPNGNVYEPTTFDGGKTYFDEHSTTFYNPVLNGGVAYTYDYFPSNSNSIINPGQFAFGQQIYDDRVVTGDAFATSVNYTTGHLVVGAPNNGSGASTSSLEYVSLFDNPNNTPAWTQIRIQQPVVDVYQLDSVFSYDKRLNSTQTYYDFFDPLQGKILGAARRNIDYIGGVDPAEYNTGTVHNNGNSWEAEHVGEMWWDTDTVRFIDPNQDDIVYASRRWGQLFPGSRVDIYQWIESTTPPASYSGQGTPLSTTSYTTSAVLGSNNVLVTRYYFWVRGITSINEGAGKTLPATAVASYITDPRSSGLPYVAALNASTLALYNIQPYLSAENTILSIGFDRTPTDGAIHQEYNLIAAGNRDAFLNDNLYRKFQDSLCGTDTEGRVVPDPLLPLAERYGVQFRPRQSMFADRFTALQNYLTRANTVLAQYPIVETRKFNLLNAAQPIPTVSSDEWDVSVPTVQILQYQDLTIVPVGYNYLVLSDSTQQGRWTIYTVTADKSLMLLKIQSYDTPLYWYYVNWYKPGYNSTISPVAAVPNYAGLAKLSYTTAPIGSSVRVMQNGKGKFEIYLRTTLDPINGWERVGLEDGTIAFKEELWNYAAGGFGFDNEVFDAQYFDQEPTVETRYIIQALNEEIYVDELLIERNNSLILMFNYIYSEFTNPEWLQMTSLVDITHNLRTLAPYQTYIQDNQNFVVDYFNEVKPYHVVVRQLNLIYNGLDTYQGTLADFDLPAYYDYALEVPQYVSPILLPYDHAQTPSRSTDSDTAADAQIWLEQPWTEWYNNYLLSIESVEVVRGGSGYTVPPVVTVTGTCTEQAVMTAVINSAGEVVAINIVNPGAGYSTSATLTITGGNGTGAIAIALMGNSLVRNIKTTMKYDRFQYRQTIFEWQANVTYTNGAQVRYNNIVWAANGTTGSVNSATFNASQWLIVNADNLSGVDRTMGYYVSTVNTPGLSLPLLVDGIEYPGVKVTGPTFAQDTGYDRGGYDINPFENLTIAPGGYPTYDTKILDTIFLSEYLDPYLGTRATDINIDGGAFVDEYSSHAPEELVPGIVFDTLDLRVYTRPVTVYTSTGTTGPFAAPTGSVDVTVTVDNVVVDPSDYTYDGVDVVFVTAPTTGTEVVVLETNPESAGLALRIFQDMRGAQADYRITPDTTTATASNVNRPIQDITDIVGDSETITVTLDSLPTIPYQVGDSIIIDSVTPSSYNGTFVVTGSVDNQITFASSVDDTYVSGGTITLDNPNVLPTDDIIYVDNIGALSTPDFDANIWGVVTINGERIMYREIDLLNNTISGLLRGTAGTAAAAHDAGAIVYNMSRVNFLPLEYQNYIVSNSTLADGTETIYTAADITLETGDELALEVYVAGIRQLSGYTLTDISPVTVEFDDAPPAGVEVTMLVRRGVDWYQPTAGEPSDGVQLQDQQTVPARFFRGY